MSAWVLACRPQTLPAAAVPVVVGSACAHAAGSLRLGPALAALAGALLLQIGANLANDVYDAEKGADGADRLGPTRAVASGLLSASAVRRAMALVFVAALGVGVYLTWVAGPAIVVLGLAAIASAIAYTGGPFPLGYHGLGDVFVMLFFGLVAVAGTVFVQAGTVTTLAWAAAVPVGALATAILVVNNLRDRTTDVRAGKRTLAVRFGRRFAIAEYAGLLLAAYAVPVALVGRGVWMLLPLVTLPFGIALLRAIAGEDGRALNVRLPQPARLLAAHGALFAVGIVLC